MDLINVNGSILKRDEAGLRVDDHSYRYGEGLFETMKLVKGKILLERLHFERLFHGFEILKLKVPELISPPMFTKEILKLCSKNNCDELSRVRLSVSGGNGGLYDGDERFQYIIECWPLEQAINELNENGLVIGVYPDARKSCDHFSNIKSANFLPYVMAAKYAKQQRLNDCLVINIHERICDATTANIFWIKKDQVFTPPLSEGCIAGVMRRWLIEKMQDAGYSIRETNCENADLENAEEIFLTNAIHGTRWVKQFNNKIYTNNFTKNIYRQFVQPQLF
jgi:branched-chain amino acid aminotransferase